MSRVVRSLQADFAGDRPAMAGIVSKFEIHRYKYVKNLKSLALLSSFLLLVISAGPVYPQLSTSAVERPTNYDTFVPPAAVASFIDPVFGSTITRVSNGNSSGGRKSTITKTSKNVHVRPGSLLKNLAVYMFEGCKGQTSFIARGKAAAVGTAATGA